MRQNLKIYCDGGARGNPGPAAAAFIVEKNSRVIYKGAKFLGKTTNNVAEYNATIIATRWILENLKEFSGQITFYLDSELVAKQLSGKFRVKNENLRNLFFTIKTLEKQISAKVNYLSVPREKNKIADFLVNKILDENS